MFGIGFTELVIILIIALVVVGPEKLPELGRTVGKTVRDLRRIYANLRAELGPEFDDIEQGIRDLRALDPRQQARDFSRNLLDDLSKDAPEIKQMASAPKLNWEQLSRDVLKDDLLDKPLSETTGADQMAVPAASPPAASDVYAEHLDVAPVASGAASSNGSTPHTPDPDPTPPRA